MNFADLTRKHSGPPVYIEAIIRGLGIELNKTADLGAGRYGQIERIEGDTYRISVNKANSYIRQRFTMAHVLGHYMLHAHLIGDGIDDTNMYRSDPKSNLYNPNITRNEETEANKFAVELLMPQSLLAAPTTIGQYVTALAQLFQVSSKAMQIRLNGLGFMIKNNVVTME